MAIGGSWRKSEQFMKTILEQRLIPQCIGIDLLLELQELLIAASVQSELDDIIGNAISLQVHNIG